MARSTHFICDKMQNSIMDAPVTAQDVIYSWERAASPELASDTVLTYLGDIVGVRKWQPGKRIILMA